MLASIDNKPTVEAGSVEYSAPDGSRCTVSTGVIPASGCANFVGSAEGISQE